MDQDGSGRVKRFGDAPYSVVAVHGGPGASGGMEPVARELSKVCGAMAPIQTAASIAGQLQELSEILETFGSLPVTLVGHSWGAWLSLLFAAKYPSLVKKLILVSSAPFEERYALEIMKTRLDRLNEQERNLADSVIERMNAIGCGNKDDLLAKFGSLMSKSDCYDELPRREEVKCQEHIFQSVWNEARSLRQTGELLRAGKSVRCPVVAIHGDYDPHPAAGVEKPLSNVIKDFRFILLKQCGHMPWFERTARGSFFQILKEQVQRP